MRYQKADGSWPVPGPPGGPPKDGWRQVTNPKDQAVYHTTLLCMMLEVYYRYLPTFAVTPSTPKPTSGSDAILSVDVRFANRPQRGE